MGEDLGILVSIMTKPLEISFIKKQLQVIAPEVTLASARYISNRKPLFFWCKCGGIFKRTWSKMVDSTRSSYCKKCSSYNKMKAQHAKWIEEIKVLAPNFDFYSVDFDHNYNRVVKWKCKKNSNHIITRQFKDIRHNTDCPECRKDKIWCQIVSYFKKEASDYILHTKEWVDYTVFLDITCPNNHRQGVSWYNFEKGHRCRYCSGNIYTIDTIREKAADLAPNYKIISDTYIDRETTLLWLCPENHKCEISWASIKNGVKCDKCHKTVSYGQKSTNDIFEKIFNKKFPTIRHKGIRNPKTNSPLELDGYNEELKLAFEYDGQQHYKLKFKFKMTIGDLEKTQYRDQVKTQRCKELGITLIRIPYWEKDNLEEFIKSELKTHRLL